MLPEAPDSGKEGSPSRRQKGRALTFDESVTYEQRILENRRLVQDHVMKDVEKLIEQKKEEQESVFLLHGISFGYFLVLGISLVVFSIAKSTRQEPYIRVYSLLGVLFVGQFPLTIIWMVYNRYYFAWLCVVLSQIVQTLCFYVCGCYYWIFGCTSMPDSLFPDSAFDSVANSSTRRRRRRCGCYIPCWSLFKRCSCCVMCAMYCQQIRGPCFGIQQRYRRRKRAARRREELRVVEENNEDEEDDFARHIRRSFALEGSDSDGADIVEMDVMHLRESQTEDV